MREPRVELEADDRVAEEFEEFEEFEEVEELSLLELSAAAMPAVMMPAAVPIPSSTANAPTRPTLTA